MSTSINLSSCPAFGFESATCNANKARLAKMSPMKDKHLAAGKRGLIEKTHYITANIFKVLGVVCPLVGVARIVEALSNNDANKHMHVARGVAELFGAGIILLGVDIAVTLHRDYSARHPAQAITG